MIEQFENKIINADCLDILKQLPNECIDAVVTSPPYFNLRKYTNNEKEIGRETTVDEYIKNLMKIFLEIKRVLKETGSLWINIDDVYIDKKLACIPDKLKICLSENGFICRNEIIWHKPNAMPCSCKDRFNNDYEKLYFFTKSKEYYFETQYEQLKTKVCAKNTHTETKNTKYIDDEQETSVRQGMNKKRGQKVVYIRKNLPEQQMFVSFLRRKTNADDIAKKCDLKKSMVEHWFRKDKGGFSYPKIDDWNKVKHLFNDGSSEYEKIDFMLNDVTIETDDIMKNYKKGRIKRAVWSISTKASKSQHFATYPEKLIEAPILSTCPEDGIVFDPFTGSGTTGVVCKKLNRKFIGTELSHEYFLIAKERFEKEGKQGILF